MNPLRINIPDVPRPLIRAAGQIVVDAIHEAGMDEAKAAEVPMVRYLVGSWGRGEHTRDEFIRLLKKLVMLNPNLKLRTRGGRYE